MSRSQEFFDSLHDHTTLYKVNSAGVTTPETVRNGVMNYEGIVHMHEAHKAGHHDLANTTLRWKDGSKPTTDDILAMRQRCVDCSVEDDRPWRAPEVR